MLLDLKAIRESYLILDIDPMDDLLYRGKTGQMDTVIVGGEVVLRNGRCTKIDKERIL